MEWPEQEPNPEMPATKYGMDTRFELESRALDLQVAVQYADGYAWFQMSGVDIGFERDSVIVEYEMLKEKEASRK
jgi:hypothetical protein